MIGVSDAVSAAALPLGNTSPVWRHAWHPVAPAAEVTGEAPTQVLVADEAWAVARLDGRLVAFEDRCPHRQSPLSAGDITRAGDGTGRLTCAYHGWRFDAAGRCDLMPGLGPRERWRIKKTGQRVALRAAYGVAEAYGLVWLAPREPLAPLPAFPEWNAPGMRRTSAAGVRTSASAGQLVDSFLDTAHGPLADGAAAAVSVSADAWQVTGVFPAVMSRLTKTAGVSGTAHARLELPRATIGILLACQPEDRMTTRVFTLIASGGTEDGTGPLAPAPSARSARSAPLNPEARRTDARDPELSNAWRRLMARASATVAGQLAPSGIAELGAPRQRGKRGADPGRVRRAVHRFIGGERLRVLPPGGGRPLLRLVGGGEAGQRVGQVTRRIDPPRDPYPRRVPLPCQVRVAVGQRDGPVQVRRLRLAARVADLAEQP
jgi:nitrite reductase/ring-hydroxylating ferredoxin subunit